MTAPASRSFASWVLGSSVEGRKLDVHAFAPRDSQTEMPPHPGAAPWPWVLFLAGVHGDEIEGVWLVEKALELWLQRYPSPRVGALLWPRGNPDGISRLARVNGHGIDLNRNLPTLDWTPEIKNPRYPPGPQAGSEPESQALVRLIEVCRPIAILSVHSFSRFQVNINGPSQAWGEQLSKLCDYPLTEDIGYPTPGCLGTYAGKERAIAAITLEIERGLPRERVLALHLPLMEKTLEYWGNKTI